VPSSSVFARAMMLIVVLNAQNCNIFINSLGIIAINMMEVQAYSASFAHTAPRRIFNN
jgi:hypothetical protein